MDGEEYNFQILNRKIDYLDLLELLGGALFRPLIQMLSSKLSRQYAQSLSHGKKKYS
jgi:hypothetical protein